METPSEVPACQVMVFWGWSWISKAWYLFLKHHPDSQGTVSWGACEMLSWWHRWQPCPGWAEDSQPPGKCRHMRCCSSYYHGAGQHLINSWETKTSVLPQLWAGQLFSPHGPTAGSPETTSGHLKPAGVLTASPPPGWYLLGHPGLQDMLVTTGCSSDSVMSFCDLRLVMAAPLAGEAAVSWGDVVWWEEGKLWDKQPQGEYSISGKRFVASMTWTLDWLEICGRQKHTR